MFEQTFKNIDDILHKDAGCTSELDYTEQSSWLLFLKYLDALEQDKASEAALEGKTYTFILAEAFRWDTWAAPKTAAGKLDHNAAVTGDDLREIVNGLARRPESTLAHRGRRALDDGFAAGGVSGAAHFSGHARADRAGPDPHNRPGASGPAAGGIAGSHAQVDVADIAGDVHRLTEGLYEDSADPV